MQFDFNKPIRFIGDIHGNLDGYSACIAEWDQTIQLGDFGVGFNIHKEDFEGISMNHRFIRGNHDNLEECRNISNWIGDYSIQNGVIFCGGGKSLDYRNRVMGYDMWPDEELNENGYFDLADYAPARLKSCKVLVSHEPPFRFRQPNNARSIKTTTKIILDHIVSEANIELCIFGHMHFSYDQVQDGIRYVCVNQNAYRDLDLRKYIIPDEQEVA